MAYGQGASAALPIVGLFLQKVFADGALPYSPDEKFVFPSGFDLCGSEDSDEEDESIDPATGLPKKSVMNDLLNY